MFIHISCLNYILVTKTNLAFLYKLNLFFVFPVTPVLESTQLNMAIAAP